MVEDGGGGCSPFLAISSVDADAAAVPMVLTSGDANRARATVRATLAGWADAAGMGIPVLVAAAAVEEAAEAEAAAAAAVAAGVSGTAAGSEGVKAAAVALACARA